MSFSDLPDEIHDQHPHMLPGTGFDGGVPVLVTQPAQPPETLLDKLMDAGIPNAIAWKVARVLEAEIEQRAVAIAGDRLRALAHALGESAPARLFRRVVLAEESTLESIGSAAGVSRQAAAKSESKLRRRVIRIEGGGLTHPVDV